MALPAFSTRAFRNYSILEAIEQIAAAGYEGIEIMCDRPHAYPADLSRAGLRKIQLTLSRTGLTVSNLNTTFLSRLGSGGYPSWIERDKAAREVRILHTVESIRLAALLGASSVSIPAGGRLSPKTREEDIDLFMEGLSRILPHAEEAGVQVLIDPAPNFILSTTREISEWLGRIGSPRLRFYFRFDHFASIGEDPFQALRALAPHIGHVHFEQIGPVADSPSAEGSKMLLKMVPALNEIGYQGFFSLALYASDQKPSELATAALGYLKMAEAGAAGRPMSPSPSIAHERSNGTAGGVALIHLPPTSSQ